MDYLRQGLQSRITDDDCVCPHYIRVHLCVSYKRLCSLTEPFTFFSVALEIWLSLFAIARDHESILEQGDLARLLRLLAALAYCDGHYLLNRNRKLVLDLKSGTSLCLPTDPQFDVGSYLEAKSALLSAISGVIADFRIPLTYSPRPEDLFPQIVHYTNDGMCILVADSRSSQCYDGFDAEGITLFNPSGICCAVESKMRLTQKQLLTFNAFMDCISHPDSDDEDGSTGGAPPGFTWDNNCGSPQLVPVEGDSLDGY
jgi:hypothetical protein